MRTTILIRFNKVAQLDQKTSLFQDNVERSIKALNDEPFIRGRIIENLTITTSGLDIEHKLGRDLKGWVIVDRNLGGDIYRQTSLEEEGILHLVSSATVTISLWVF